MVSMVNMITAKSWKNRGSFSERLGTGHRLGGVCAPVAAS
jgi:hypothetical protein